MLNCIEIPGWYSCCIATLPGSCVVESQDSLLVGVCNVTGLPLFTASCDTRTDAGCSWDEATTSQLCKRLCFDC